MPARCGGSADGPGAAPRLGLLGLRGTCGDLEASDAKSSSDANPQVTAFTYTSTGQVATEGKPNGNTVASTYYANGLPYTQTENTSGGTLVSSHVFSYDPNGNQAKDIEQLMSADDNASQLSHTLTYSSI